MDWARCPWRSFGASVVGRGFIGAPSRMTCLHLAAPCSPAVVALLDLSSLDCAGGRLVVLDGGFISTPGRITSTIFRWRLLLLSSFLST